MKPPPPSIDRDDFTNTICVYNLLICSLPISTFFTALHTHTCSHIRFYIHTKIAWIASRLVICYTFLYLSGAWLKTVPMLPSRREEGGETEVKCKRLWNCKKTHQYMYFCIEEYFSLHNNWFDSNQTFTIVTVVNFVKHWPSISW